MICGGRLKICRRRANKFWGFIIMINNDNKTKKPYNTADMVLCGYSTADILAVSNFENDGSDITWTE